MVKNVLSASAGNIDTGVESSWAASEKTDCAVPVAFKEDCTHVGGGTSELAVFGGCWMELVDPNDIDEGEGKLDNSVRVGGMMAGIVVFGCGASASRGYR